MKNIQVIDGALNSTFSIFQASDEEFAVLFPEPGQEIQYAEDLAKLPGQPEICRALEQLWERPIRKRDAQGIHGTLLYQLERYKQWYKVKREDGIDARYINAAQRRLFGID
jgi:hypothetical protein